MVTLTIEGIDLFKVPGRSISGWIPSLKTGIAVRQPFCSQIEERLGSGLNLQNVDGRGLMQSTFPCHVHADAHDWRQLLMFEGKTCSLDGAFTNSTIRRMVNSVAGGSLTPARAGMSIINYYNDRLFLEGR